MLPLAATVITVVTDAILAASTAGDTVAAAVATDIAAADTTCMSEHQATRQPFLILFCLVIFLAIRLLWLHSQILVEANLEMLDAKMLDLCHSPFK